MYDFTINLLDHNQRFLDTGLVIWISVLWSSINDMSNSCNCAPHVLQPLKNVLKNVKFYFINCSIEMWTVEDSLEIIWRQKLFLVNQIGHFKILMAKIKRVQSHYLALFYDTIYTESVLQALIHVALKLW